MGIVIQNNPNAIELGLYELVGNTKKLNIMQENAISLINSEYAWDKILSEYNEMYQEAKKI